MVKKVSVSLSLLFLVSSLSMLENHGMSYIFGEKKAVLPTGTSQSEILPIDSAKSLSLSGSDDMVVCDPAILVGAPLEEKLRIAQEANRSVVEIIQKLGREEQDLAYQKLLNTISDSPEHLLHLAMAPWKEEKAILKTRIENASSQYGRSLQKAVQQAHQIERSGKKIADGSEINEELSAIIDLRLIEDTAYEALKTQIEKEISDAREIAPIIVKKERWINRHPIKFAAGSVGTTLAILAILGSQQK